MNVELSNQLETDMRKLINKARMEVLEVCSREYKFDINAAMLLVGAGMERKVPVAKEKKETPKKAVKELLEDRNSLEGKRNSKGRPKNPDKVVEVEETDNLFEQLVNTQLEQVEEDVVCSVVFQTKEEKKKEESAEKMERGLMSGAEKETKVVEKMMSKEQEKAEKLALKEQEKEYKLLCQQEAKMEATASAIAAKEQEKMAKLAEKEAEKEIKEQEKMAKLAEKEAEKMAKLEATAIAIAAKEEAKKAKLAEKESKKVKKSESGSESDSSKKTKKTKGKRIVEATAIAIAKEANDVEYQKKMTEQSAKLEAEAEVKVQAVAVVAASAPATLKVKSFKFEGVTYFREKNTGAIYDKDTNDHLGQWNEATQKIEFLEPEEELEEEEESVGESSDEEEEEEDA